jgi:flagellar biosynthesis chaperone FliJ
MKNVSTLNYKMADEIETLKTVIKQITSENNQMKIILEMKQTERIEVEKNKASSTIKSTSVTSTPKNYAAVVSNTFETLVDKHVTNESSNDDLTETSVESGNLNCPPENISSQTSVLNQLSINNQTRMKV